MTINEQLHASRTHKRGIDPSCPACSPLVAIIAGLNRCAAQNEKDAGESPTARAVAEEQRRVIAILKGIRG